MSPGFDPKQFHDRTLQTRQLAMFIVELPMHEAFFSAVGSRRSRKALIIRWTDQNGEFGFGECSCRTDPYYSHEFLEGCVVVIKKFIAPLLFEGSTLFADFYQRLNKIHGWNFAKSAVLDAIFHVWNKCGEADPLTAWKKPELDSIPIGISLGIYKNMDELFDKIRDSINAGYRRIKLKISPQQGFEYLQLVRREFPETKLLVDANGSYGENDFEFLKRCVELDLEAIEQPFPPARLDLCRQLKNKIPPLQICLDESVSSIGHLYSALDVAMDELNIKIGRVGGIINAIEIAERCAQEGVPHWVGGMFETGIGRTNNLRFAAKLEQYLAHDLSPPSRYFLEDIISHKIIMNQNGRIDRPKYPAEIDERLFVKYLVDKQIVTRQS